MDIEILCDISSKNILMEFLCDPGVSVHAVLNF